MPPSILLSPQDCLLQSCCHLRIASLNTVVTPGNSTRNSTRAATKKWLVPVSSSEALRKHAGQGRQPKQPPRRQRVGAWQPFDSGGQAVQAPGMKDWTSRQTTSRNEVEELDGAARWSTARWSLSANSHLTACSSVQGLPGSPAGRGGSLSGGRRTHCRRRWGQGLAWRVAGKGGGSRKVPKKLSSRTVGAAKGGCREAPGSASAHSLRALSASWRPSSSSPHRARHVIPPQTSAGQALPAVRVAGREEP